LSDVPPDHQPDVPPSDPKALAVWLQEAVTAEVQALEKEGASQSYELLSGRLLESLDSNRGIYQFVVADGLRLPEEATGRLKVGQDDYEASVVGQEADRIALEVTCQTALPFGMARAIFTVDDTQLLKKLAEALGQLALSPGEIGVHAATAFNPSHAQIGSRALPDMASEWSITGEQQAVLEQALGSSITFVWGPPGTGKTHVIAHLVASLAEIGERVLVTSHTHAAVDASLYAAVRADDDGRGPLANHQIFQEGKVLRVGRTQDQKIPDSVRLDELLESRVGDLESRLREGEAQARRLSAARAEIEAALRTWDRLVNGEALARRAIENLSAEDAKLTVAFEAVQSAEEISRQARLDLERARGAWLFRRRREERAERALAIAEAQLAGARFAGEGAARRVEAAEAQCELRDREVLSARTDCGPLAPRADFEAERDNNISETDELQAEIQELQEAVAQAQQQLLDEARAVFCTLTKCYVGKELASQTFDAVIVDEISMALPPLVFLAASRAANRVVLVGDFNQLPPIVRSDSEISSRRLREDMFHLAGMAIKNRPADSPSLTRLRTQQRMLPPIADAARSLVYGADGLIDGESVCNRGPVEWADKLSLSPLLIVDTSDLHCWSGKQPGSLSRFNFYSATIATELAAAAASHFPSPPASARRPIGIITPFAAQRRLLSRLTDAMKLQEWVATGTVHTFQGSEAELIIFDSTLDEPYWSARLCDPAAVEDVVRELNVAVTRARDKFLFVGSSEWLNKHAKSSSGLGKLWDFMKERAPLLPAAELVGEVLPNLGLADSPDDGWKVPVDEGASVHEVLDERTFFERFEADMAGAVSSVFGLVPFFGEYRWPRIQPLFAAALSRGVEVTLVTPPLSEAENRSYVERAVANLRQTGAVVISASGLHGKDIVIDERVHYTGSLNWASHRGRSEIMHRTSSSALARTVLQYAQARYVRRAAVHEDGTARTCPVCSGVTQVVNQRQQHGAWDFQAMKVGCANPDCRTYLRNLEERPPFRSVPVCGSDGETRYRRVRRGRGEAWQCPKHPRECPMHRVVPGDP